jgi:hypothetical protein
VARIRTIKPEFWKHEDLSELPEATHMLAAALLNYADDEGYFNANPGLIKGECCPLREPSVSIQDSLAHLSRIGFIMLGTSENGKRYGLITTFLEHQRINRPTPSKISDLGIVWDDSPQPHPQVTEQSPPERNREQGTGNMNSEPNGSVVGATADPPPEDDLEIPLTLDRTDVGKAVANYNLAADELGLPKVLKLTNDRRRRLQARLKEHGLKGWNEGITNLEASKFCRGENDRGWKADFEFLLQPKSLNRLIEGGYTDE